MKQNNKKGFTLAELLIVVAIIAVLVAIAIPVFTTQLEKSREATDAANVRAAYATLVTQYLDKGEADSIEVEAQQMKADWQTNPAVEQVIARAPLSRLVTETDGLDAVAWALGRPVEPEEIPGVILGELRAIARAKGVSEAEARVRVWENMMAFIHGA